MFIKSGPSRMLTVGLVQLTGHLHVHYQIC